MKGDLVGDLLFIERFVLYQVQYSSSPQLPRKAHLNKRLMYSVCMGPNKSGEKNIATTTHIHSAHIHF